MKLLKIHYLYFFIYYLFKHKKNSNYLNRKSSYQILRTLYRLTNGFLTNLIGYILSSFKLNNPNKFDQGFKNLEKISEEHINLIASELKKMKVFDQRFINNFNFPDKDKKVKNYASNFDKLSKKDIIRIDVLKSELLSNKIITKFVLNEKWISVVKEIINVDPVLIDVSSWYTIPHKNDLQLNKYSAQIWHRDVDKIRDIKILLYLTDVTLEGDGPFQIIKNTHKSDFSLIKYDNNNNFRISEQNLNKKYHNRKKLFLGKKGTNFIVDTRCLHKGGLVTKGYRHILELYFSNSSFGKHEYFNEFTRPRLNPNWESYQLWKNAIIKNPINYKSIFLGREPN